MHHSLFGLIITLNFVLILTIVGTTGTVKNFFLKENYFLVGNVGKTDMVRSIWERAVAETK